ncbi:MAG: carboxypeptidase-like regulatory domain-containing protein, partial [Pyrinomonadaceae bacterium]
MATVKGTVMDSNGAVIVTPKPSIVFERNEQISKVVANENGDYEVTLPPGVYTVTTDIGGYYPFRRAEFGLLPGSRVMINLIPTPRYL